MPPSENVVTIIQARVGSSRLPGKVMMSVLDRPLLARLLERVLRARLVGAVVVATTVYAEDDEIARLCWNLNIGCFRGDADDLLDRHYRAALKYDADVVVKIPSDCPLIDPAVIDRVIGAYLARPGAYDYVSNLHPPSYPDGNDVEVMRMPALERAWREAWNTYEREHTTPYFWENPDQFRLHNVSWETGLNYARSHRWTVDYAQDLLLVQAIYGALYPQNPHFTLEDILALLAREPQLLAVNAAYAGADSYRHHIDELRTISATDTRIPEVEHA